MAEKPPRPLESKVQRAIIVQARRFHGVRLYRRNVGRAQLTGGFWVRFASPGQSDLWGVLPGGRHLEIECKRPGGRPTEAQRAWLREMTEAGAVAFWADSARWCDQVLGAVIKGATIRWLDSGDGADYDVIMPPGVTI